jgi:nitrile hydratase subunit beta
MNGIHDVGGMENLGEINRPENEKLFYADWQRRAFGLMVGTAGQGLFNIDEFRHGIEKLGPVDYLTLDYYSRWLFTIEQNLVEKGILDAEELETITQSFLMNPDKEIPRRENKEKVKVVEQIMNIGASPIREVSSLPCFKVGERVKTRNIQPSGHTRFPRYSRDKYGVIHTVHPAHVFPDANAHGKGESPEYLYTVSFGAHELWGEKKSEIVYLDLWESYLEPVSN